MSHSKFSAVKDAIERSDLDVRCYSGRGMFGENCLGVVVQNTLSAVAAITENLLAHDPTFAVVGLFDHAHTDNMGKEDMILYFPHLAWEGDEIEPARDPEEEDEEEAYR